MNGHPWNWSSGRFESEEVLFAAPGSEAAGNRDEGLNRPLLLGQEKSVKKRHLSRLRSASVRGIRSPRGVQRFHGLGAVQARGNGTERLSGSHPRRVAPGCDSVSSQRPPAERHSGGRNLCGAGYGGAPRGRQRAAAGITRHSTRHHRGAGARSQPGDPRRRGEPFPSDCTCSCSETGRRRHFH